VTGKGFSLSHGRLPFYIEIRVLLVKPERGKVTPSSSPSPVKGEGMVSLGEKSKGANKMFDWDAIIVGGGPAGMAAGLYLSRANYRTLLLEKKAWAAKSKM